MSLNQYVPWQDRAFVTVRETASIFARSAEWVRDCMEDGELVAVRQRRGGPALVCVESVLRLRDRLRSGLPSMPQPQPRSATRPRLVWTHPSL